MSDDEWQHMGLPPLRISEKDLQDLEEIAGEQAQLELADSESDLPADVTARLTAPGLKLSLAKGARSTELAFQDEEEAVALAERILERLDPCRRRGASLTHTDGAIFVGMLMPIAAGMLAPASMTLLACGLASVLWMLYLLWAQNNASKSWCVFRDRS